MSDLVLLFHQVQFLFDSRIVLVLVLSYLEKNLDHVLDPLVDVLLMKNAPKLVKNSQSNGSAHLLKMLPNFSRQTNCNLNTVIGGLVKEKQQYLRSYHLMCHLLVDQMCNKCCRRQTDSFIIPLESLLELNDQTIEQELSNLRKFRVDNSRHSCIYRREWQACGLSFHDTSAE